MNWDPVCGADGETYGNNCQAEAAGATVVSEGECAPPVQPTLPAGCTMEYDPVCGADSVTYANSCLAEAAGWTVVSEGKCPVQPTPPQVAYVVGCNENYEPVCGANGQTYSNKCGADTEVYLSFLKANVRLQQCNQHFLFPVHWTLLRFAVLTE